MLFQRPSWDGLQDDPRLHPLSGLTKNLNRLDKSCQLWYFLINSRNSPRLAAGMNAELGKGVGETEVSPPAESSERSER